jgi:hypothetical protein
MATPGLVANVPAATCGAIGGQPLPGNACIVNRNATSLPELQQYGKWGTYNTAYGEDIKIYGVTLSKSINAVVTVHYATANGTALARSDYTATSGTLTFYPGETSHTVSIGINSDRKREPNEAFSVQLSNAVGATISDGVATATILNDD